MSTAIDNVPAEIVRRLLERGSEVAARTAARAGEFAKARAAIRKGLDGLVSHVDDAALDASSKPSVAAVDGGFVCDSKSIGDLCTAVAVKAGPEEDDGDCDVWMDSVTRSPQNKEVLSGIMSTMEIELASAAQADVVMMDGSMLGTMINVSKAMHASGRVGGQLSDRIQSCRTDRFRETVMSVLLSSRHISIPKYTTTNEFADYVPEEFRSHDARTVMTMALLPGEMTYFSCRGTDDRNDARRMLIAPALRFSKADAGVFSAAMDGIVSCYYRPHPWTQAFRIDMTAAALEDENAQLAALRAVRDTTRTAGLLEPFPLYLVDLFAKQVSVGAAPVVEMAALSAIEDPDARLLLAMGYRT